MLDAHIRPLIDPPLNKIGLALAKRGITADQITLCGFVLGLAAMALIMAQFYLAAALFLVANRICDGLDGAVARHTKLTDFGGFLDIVCDFIIYAGIVFAFGIGHPDRIYAAAFLIFSFIGPIATFLAYAIIAAKKQVTTAKRGSKSFYYLGGLCEGTETATALILMCLIPSAFAIICVVFGVMCWLTTIGRSYAAWRDFAN